jgi:hypothetical protein
VPTSSSNRECSQHIDISSAGPRSPIIILGYAYNGASDVQRLLSRDANLACTSGTGLLPLCELAVTTWQQVEKSNGLLSSLAITSIRAMTSSMITTVLAANGKKRWCEIAFTRSRCAEIFLQIYPSAKFVCLHRSFPGVVYSGVKANPWGFANSAFLPFAARFPGNAVAAIAAYWTVSTESLLEFERAHPDDCRHVRYEDVLRNPNQECADVSSFLSLNQDNITDRNLMNEDLLYSPEDRDGAVAEFRIPFDWVPQSLMARVNQLMAEAGYQEIPRP